MYCSFIKYISIFIILKLTSSVEIILLYYLHYLHNTEKCNNTAINVNDISCDINVDWSLKCLKLSITQVNHIHIIIYPNYMSMMLTYGILYIITYLMY